MQVLLIFHWCSLNKQQYDCSSSMSSSAAQRAVAGEGPEPLMPGQGGSDHAGEDNECDRGADVDGAADPDQQSELEDRHDGEQQEQLQEHAGRL